jgi:hypothetical protein
VKRAVRSLAASFGEAVAIEAGEDVIRCSYRQQIRITDEPPRDTTFSSRFKRRMMLPKRGRPNTGPLRFTALAAVCLGRWDNHHPINGD